MCGEYEQRWRGVRGRGRRPGNFKNFSSPRGRIIPRRTRQVLRTVSIKHIFWFQARLDTIAANNTVIKVWEGERQSDLICEPIQDYLDAYWRVRSANFGDWNSRVESF